MLTEQYNPAAKLKTACLGLGRKMPELIDLACDSGLYELVSVADSDITNTEKVVQKYNCTAFNDYRQFILQNDINLLIVAEPLYKCTEYIKVAINKKCNILKFIPTAANFELAAELIDLAEKNGVKYITAVPTRFAPGFECLCDYIRSVDRKQFHFINICASFGSDFFQPIISDEKADPKLRGGGVLIADCFELLSLTIANFSMPNQVYALLTNQIADRKAKQYLGEDTVTASLVFKDGLIGTFLASRQTGVSLPPAPLRIYGNQQHLAATPNRLAVYDNNGTLISENKFPLKPEKCITEMFIDIGRALLEPEKYKLRRTSRLDLATMALIEAAYLSAKTGMPESPSRFFEISEKEKFPFA